MNKETIVMLGIIAVLVSFMIVALIDLAIVQEEEIGTKILIDYEPKAFFKPSIAKFDDGTVYENLDFVGGICIGAKYKIVRLRSWIFGCNCGIRAIRCS